MKEAIHPTHTCFDDALDFLADLSKNFPAALYFERYRLVHAICTMPDGQPYAHAWVETYAGTAHFFGILKGERVRVTVDAAEYRQELKMQHVTEYTPEEAWEENRKSENFGPWIPRYRELCKDSGQRKEAAA